MKLCFVTTFIGPPHLAKISNNFKRVEDCDYLLFTNLKSEEVKSGWDVITIDLEEFNYLKSAVKISRYFKFMLHEYMKKIGRDYDFVFYCDCYRYPKDNINWEINNDENIEIKLRSKWNSEFDIPDGMIEIVRILNSSNFLHSMSAIFRINQIIPDPYFTGGGLNLIRRNGLLAVHVDGNYHKKMKQDNLMN